MCLYFLVFFWGKKCCVNVFIVYGYVQLNQSLWMSHVSLTFSWLVLFFFFLHFVSSEFLKAKCLMNCEVSLILEHKYEQLQQTSDDPMNQVSQ